jgi:hypothetical protein
MPVDLGVFAALGVGDVLPTTTGLDFLNETLSANETIRDLSGLRGTRDHAAGRSRVVSRSPGGDITMNPNPTEMNAFLPYVMGGTPAVGGSPVKTTFPLGETLPSFAVQLKKGAKMYSFSGCKAGQTVFRSTYANPLEVVLSVLAAEETPAASSGFPALSLNAQNPFVHSDLVFNVGGTNYEVFNFSLSVGSALYSRNVNSVTPTQIVGTDLVIEWAYDLAHGDADALYGAGAAGLAHTATYTNGNLSVAFVSPKVVYSRERPPSVAGREEVRLPIRGMARYSAAPLDALSVVLDLTP